MDLATKTKRTRYQIDKKTACRSNRTSRLISESSMSLISIARSKSRRSRTAMRAARRVTVKSTQLVISV